MAKVPSFRPATGLLDLQDGRQFSRAEFEAVPLRPLSPEAVQATERGGLLLSLDEQSPRPLLAAGATLGSVVDEDRELSPGWHVLVASFRAVDEVFLGTWHFQIELDLPRPTRDSACVLLEPGGTVFSPPGGSIELLAVPLVPEVARFEYHLPGHSPALIRVPALESVRATGLQSGDHRLEVRCYDQANLLVGHSERIVTINADERQKNQ